MAHYRRTVLLKQPNWPHKESHSPIHALAAYSRLDLQLHAYVHPYVYPSAFHLRVPKSMRQKQHAVCSIMNFHPRSPESEFDDL